MRLRTAPVLGVLLCAACAVATLAGQSGTAVDRDRLMREVATLAAPAMEGRRAGTAGGMKARAWLVERFGEIGLTPAGTSGYLQPFTAVGRNGRAAAANVIGRVAGTDPRARTIVVTAHYDHDGIRGGALYHGADDNASGVVVLLAAARHFSMQRPRHPIVFAALDAEEMGQRGAAALLESGLIPRDAIALNVNLDMLSRSDRNEIYAAGTSHHPWIRPIVEEAARPSKVTVRFGHDTGGGADDWTTQSDHGEFHKAGLPWVYFGVENHPDYHQPTDTADKINVTFFGDVADMIVAALRTFDARIP
ncbi:MAG: M20/M25/M40 family metallo-hydrolase [Acidimicrobiia bacterium]|nr:M20/M25/M40 family metallo-hydrolase [Acidimicrobiia bacterium]